MSEKTTHDYIGVLISIKEAVARLEERVVALDRHLGLQLEAQDVRLTTLETRQDTIKSELNIQVGKWAILTIILTALVAGVVSNTLTADTVSVLPPKAEYKADLKGTFLDDGLDF